MNYCSITNCGRHVCDGLQKQKDPTSNLNPNIIKNMKKYSSGGLFLTQVSQIVVRHATIQA